LQNPEEEEWEAFKKEIAVEMTVSQDLQVKQLNYSTGNIFKQVLVRRLGSSSRADHIP
jgi:hypothetical protein